jgi:hypothetical protein
LTTLVPLLDFAILIRDCHRAHGFWIVFVNVNFNSLTAFLTFQHFIHTIINESSDNLVLIANKPFIIWKLLNFLIALQVKSAIGIFDNGNGLVVFIIFE